MWYSRLARLGGFLLLVSASFYCPAAIDNIETEDAAAQQGNCECMETEVHGGQLGPGEVGAITLTGFTIERPPQITILVGDEALGSAWTADISTIRTSIAENGRMSLTNNRMNAIRYRVVVSSW